MDQGNALRDKGESADALAAAAIREIMNRREKPNEPSPRRAFVLHQLKHPKEVATLRSVYGRGFFLLGVTDSKLRRIRHLTKGIGMSAEEAKELIKRDEDEADRPLGQRTRQTFHLADAFLSLDMAHLKEAIWRVLDLIFGHPCHTPTMDEYSMFMAYAASLRSGDLSRQVGAVIARRTGEIIATGANDVPQPGGGQYWPDDDPFLEKSKMKDQRDYVLGYDSNSKIRDEILIAVVRALHTGETEKPDDEVLRLAKKKLENTGLLDLTEYGRAVHAEMAALLCCARVGVSCKDSLLFSTTFPCHNCTKHLVAAGIAEVVYVEPYPKSKAVDLHGDAVDVPSLNEDPESEDDVCKVIFRPFVGVGPRRFIDLFSMTLGDGRGVKRKETGTGLVANFVPKTAGPRIPMQPTTYFERETKVFGRLDKTIEGNQGGNNGR